MKQTRNEESTQRCAMRKAKAMLLPSDDQPPFPCFHCNRRFWVLFSLFSHLWKISGLMDDYMVLFDNDWQIATTKTFSCLALLSEWYSAHTTVKSTPSYLLLNHPLQILNQVSGIMRLYSLPISHRSGLRHIIHKNKIDSYRHTRIKTCHLQKNYHYHHIYSEPKRGA